MTLPVCAGIAAHAEQLWQRALSLVLSLCNQRKNRTKKENKNSMPNSNPACSLQLNSFYRIKTSSSNKLKDVGTQ